MRARPDGNELQEIRAMLDEIRADLKRLTDSSARGGASSQSLENRAVDVLLSQLLEDIDVGLERGMVKSCGMRETCKAVFTDLLHKSAGMVGSNSVSEEDVNRYRSELERRRSEAPKSQCARCFGEVSGLFDKHIRITRSLKIYRSDEEARRAIESLSEDSVMRNVLEPLSNRQRLQIMKMLASHARSFSAISDHSGLRGGNLLFHLQRLSDAGMIVQQHERGDYLLTEKGYKVLRAISEIASSLEEEPSGTPTTVPTGRRGNARAVEASRP